MIFPLHEDGLHRNEVPEFGNVFLGHLAFDLWDHIGVRDTDSALQILKENPKIASMNPVALDQSVALKAVSCQQKEVLEALLENPHTDFGFTPAMQSPLMLAIVDPVMHKYVEPLAEKCFAFRWPSNQIIKGLSPEYKMRILIDLTTFRDNIQSLRKSGLISPKWIEEISTHFEHEKKRVEEAMKP